MIENFRGFSGFRGHLPIGLPMWIPWQITHWAVDGDEKPPCLIKIMYEPPEAR
jgi:hypothetical protein